MLAVKGKASPMESWSTESSADPGVGDLVALRSRQIPVLRLRPLLGQASQAPQAPKSIQNRPSGDGGRKRFTFRLSVEDHTALRALAKRDGVSANGVLTRALAAWIAQEEPST
jgi:hypothetical protein